MIAKTQGIDVEQISKQIEALCKENQKHNNNITVSYIKKIVPEYISNNSEYEVLDIQKTNSFFILLIYKY